jgi:UDP-GlcNAc:undecaprenyl-phosphate GlcNAc-1-phosphate transferase
LKRLLVRNYRGVEVPALLGPLLAATGGAGALLVLAFAGPIHAEGWIGAGGAVLVFAAGLADDVLPGRARGLRAHLSQLSSGRVTTGIVKLLVIVAGSLIVVASGRSLPGWTSLPGVVLLAGSANLVNGLDVRPGRAIKFALPLGVLALVGDPFAAVPAVPGVLFGAAVALPVDLRERAMLGDSGSNLLGFSVGLAALRSLPVWAIWLAAACVLALNVVADTYTLSKAIDGTPLLRRFDRSGREA